MCFVHNWLNKLIDSTSCCKGTGITVWRMISCAIQIFLLTYLLITEPVQSMQWPERDERLTMLLDDLHLFRGQRFTFLSVLDRC